LEDVETGTVQEVPRHLKDASYPGAEKLNRGKDYKYPHAFKNHYVKQKYMPEAKKYYLPTDSGYEKKIKVWLEQLKKHNC
jgi:putative ATPase